MRGAVLFAAVPVFQAIAVGAVVLASAPAHFITLASLAVFPVIVALGLHDRVAKTVVTLAPEPARVNPARTQAR